MNSFTQVRHAMNTARKVQEIRHQEYQMQQAEAQEAYKLEFELYEQRQRKRRTITRKLKGFEQLSATATKIVRYYKENREVSINSRTMEVLEPRRERLAKAKRELISAGLMSVAREGRQYSYTIHFEKLVKREKKA